MKHHPLNVIKAAFPNRSEMEIHEYLDFCCDENCEPSTHDFAIWIALG